MHTLTLERFVHISHAVRLYDGVVEPMHSHRWIVSVSVSAPELDEIGAVMDFNRLAALLGGVLADLDGKNLGEHPAFAGTSSSSERVAEHVFHALKPQIPSGVTLDEVSLYRDEAIRARFAYRGGTA